MILQQQREKQQQQLKPPGMQPLPLRDTQGSDGYTLLMSGHAGGSVETVQHSGGSIY